MAVIQDDGEAVAHPAPDESLVTQRDHHDRKGSQATDLYHATVERGQNLRPIGEPARQIPVRRVVRVDQRR